MIKESQVILLEESFCSIAIGYLHGLLEQENCTQTRVGLPLVFARLEARVPVETMAVQPLPPFLSTSGFVLNH